MKSNKVAAWWNASSKIDLFEYDYQIFIKPKNDKIIKSGFNNLEEASSWSFKNGYTIVAEIKN